MLASDDVWVVELYCRLVKSRACNYIEVAIIRSIVGRLNLFLSVGPSLPFVGSGVCVGSLKEREPRFIFKMEPPPQKRKVCAHKRYLPLLPIIVDLMTDVVLLYGFILGSTSSAWQVILGLHNCRSVLSPPCTGGSDFAGEWGLASS